MEWKYRNFKFQLKCYMNRLIKNNSKCGIDQMKTTNTFLSIFILHPHSIARWVHCRNVQTKYTCKTEIPTAPYLYSPRFFFCSFYSFVLIKLIDRFIKAFCLKNQSDPAGSKKNLIFLFSPNKMSRSLSLLAPTHSHSVDFSLLTMQHISAITSGILQYWLS